MHVQTDLWRIRRADTGEHLDYRLRFDSYSLYHWRKAEAEKTLAELREGMGPAHITYGVLDQLEMYPVPVCGVCGAWNPQYVDAGVYRCWKHLKSNACVIDGCSRSRKTDRQPRDDWFMCSAHWRAFVPPKSPMRRIYNRVWRIVKKGGWTMKLRRREQRIWQSIVRRARQAHSGQFEGFVDEAEINRLFGWD